MFFGLILFMGFSRQEYWSGLPFPPPVDCVLSELFTVTHLSWVALHGMAHSFIEVCKPLHHNKAVIHEGKILQIKLNYWASLYPISFEGVATIMALVFPL